MTSSLASPSMNPSPTINPNNSSSRRRKQKKIQNQSSNTNDQNQTTTSIKWKSQFQQNLYAEKLLRALRHVQETATSSSPSRVRQAADRVLAITAKGRSRWSRAILTGGGSRLKLEFAKRKKKTMAKQQRSLMMNITSSTARNHCMVVTANNRLMQRRSSKLGVVRVKSGGLPAVQRKARILGRLVPGCRRQPLPVVLEEVSDYIPALEMQVRVMSTLTELLSGSGSSSNLSTGGSTPVAHRSSLWPDQLIIDSSRNHLPL